VHFDKDASGWTGVVLREEKAALAEVLPGVLGVEARFEFKKPSHFECAIDQRLECAEVGFFGESKIHRPEFPSCNWTKTKRAGEFGCRPSGSSLDAFIASRDLC
jgi:hypothetical protein